MMTEVWVIRRASNRLTWAAEVYESRSRTSKSLESCQRDRAQWWQKSSFSSSNFVCCIQCLCMWSVFLLWSTFVLDIYSRKFFVEVCLMNSFNREYWSALQEINILQRSALVLNVYSKFSTGVYDDCVDDLLQRFRPPLADHTVEHDTSVLVVTENRNHGSLETGMKVVNCDARGDVVR